MAQGSGNSSRTGAPRPNSVGLSGAALEALLDTFDANAPQDHTKREYVRWPFRRHSVMLRVAQPSGIEVTLRVACRNISRGGMSILHNSYLHPGSRCAAALPHPTQRFVKVSGTIVRSTHRTGTIHEVGVSFDTPIDPVEFLDTDPLHDYYNLESVDTEQLHGSILHIDDSELDRKIVQHYLRDTQLRIRPAGTIGEAMEIAEDGVDLILCDYYLESETGEDLVRELRANGDSTPVVLVTSDTSQVMREKIAQIPYSSFIAKPFTEQLLLRAIGEFLLVRGQQSSGKSTLTAEDPNRQMLDTFVRDLHSFAERLEKNVEQDNLDRCRNICLQIKTTAPQMGFGQIAQLASTACDTLSSTGSVRDAAAELRSLAGACKRATVS